MLIRIVAPHFVAGVVTGVRAAPIVRYMARWSRTQIEAYCATKRWRFELLD